MLMRPMPSISQITSSPCLSHSGGLPVRVRVRARARARARVRVRVGVRVRVRVRGER